MGEYQPKTLAPGKGRNRKKFSLWLLSVMLLCIALGIGASWYFLQLPDKAPPENPENAGFAIIETPYCDLRLQWNAAQQIRHVQSEEDAACVNVFYMKDTGKELFRVYFAAEERGTYLGTLHVGAEEISVCLEVPQYVQEDFKNKREYKTYCVLMEQLKVVQDSILANEDLQSDSGTPDQTVPSARYVTVGQWQVELPDNVIWIESATEDDYQADFHTYIDGEKILLYTIKIGTPTDTVVGKYLLNGEEKSLCIRSYSLREQVDWTDEERTMSYAYAMETVNSVLHVIMENENFLG